MKKKAAKKRLEEIVLALEAKGMTVLVDGVRLEPGTEPWRKQMRQMVLGLSEEELADILQPPPES